MKILVACEYSGIVSDAFRLKGHNVTSCDLDVSLSDNNHYQGDVFDIINDGFDMMIAFPPCTYLCKAQYHLLLKNEERKANSEKAIDFVRRLYFSNIKKIAIENPIGILSKKFMQPTQICYSNMFGDPHKKDFCLWLKNLPPLIYTCQNLKCQPVRNHINGRMTQAEKSKIKSKFFPLVAVAMANQWT
jgi:site-specific DNA-cytosine methylase